MVDLDWVIVKVGLPIFDISLIAYYGYRIQQAFRNGRFPIDQLSWLVGKPTVTVSRQDNPRAFRGYIAGNAVVLLLLFGLAVVLVLAEGFGISVL